MDNRPIGVFDSGLGGLTAVKELMRILPNERILYFGDTGRVPYGSRGRETIRRYAKQDMNFLLQHDVKAVLAACGTVSSTARDIGEALPVPYLDVLRPTAQTAVQHDPERAHRRHRHGGHDRFRLLPPGDPADQPPTSRFSSRPARSLCRSLKTPSFSPAG